MSWSLEQQGAVAIASFNRPPDNQITFEQVVELDGLLQKVARDESVSVVMLASDCPGYFIAHADREQIGRLAAGEQLPVGLESWLWTLLRIESLPQPVIAAVDGQAWGGGCELALACTFRVGSAAAHFSQLEIGRGAMPGAGGTQRLPRLVGPARAAWMILTGHVVHAEEALAIGLLDAIVESDSFRAAALEWAAPLLDKPRAALVAAKRALVEGQRMPFVQALMHEQRLFHELLATRAGR